MSGPAGVLALVLAETAAGGALFLFLSPLWNETRRGFFYVVGIVVLVFAAAATGSAAAGYDPRSGGRGHLAEALALSLTVATLVWLLLLAFKQRTPARVMGLLTVPLAVVMLGAFARTADRDAGLAFFQLVAGAGFMGAVMDGLLLGHWYLTDRKLTRTPINRSTLALLGAVVLEAGAVIAGAFGHHAANSATAASLSPLLTVAGIASWIAFGMVACTGLIAVMIKLTLRETRPAAVQSATGFFYLAVITAFTGELASKVKFLP